MRRPRGRSWPPPGSRHQRRMSQEAPTLAITTVKYDPLNILNLVEVIGREIIERTAQVHLVVVFELKFENSMVEITLAVYDDSTITTTTGHAYRPVFIALTAIQPKLVSLNLHC